MRFSICRESSSLLFVFSILNSVLLFSYESSNVVAHPLQHAENPSILDTRAPTPNIPDPDQVNELIKDNGKFADYARTGEPREDKSIFFTGQTSSNINKIVAWANGVGLTSVRNIWKSANFYQKGQYDKVDADVFKKFQQGFSKYYATQTKGKAYLVFPHDQTPKSSGIFYSIELEEIIDGGKVDEIIWIDQTRVVPKDSKYDWKTETKTYWKRGQSKPAGGT
ncbi:hypothetical protein F4778DRAFT_775758 [Xylariomycetidae sp. FL2044]|nr:hypothetical protein F4778DRAFT_775758 [Xylariomycetidae sp. FL2044]